MTTERPSWSPDVFDRLYAASEDPWGFHTSPYEREKYAATLAALPERRFASAFEVGCSIGVLTRQLAGRCDRLLSVDVAEAALEAARGHCAGLDHVEFRRMHVPGEWPERGFDLVALSEVLYFLGPADLALTAQRVAASLLPGGLALLVNWTGETNSPSTGDEAATLFMAAATPQLTPALHRRAPRYRLDLLRRSG